MPTERPGIILSQAELLALTGYKRPHDQLPELLRQGFSRARRGRCGVLLERAHYEAVCAGRAANAPKVRPPKLRA